MYAQTDSSNLPMALLLLNDRITDWAANAVGKKYFGRGYACSRYTTSDPDRFGKYDAYSRYTLKELAAMRKPKTQYIIARPTDPVPERTDAAEKVRCGTHIRVGINIRVEYTPVPIILLMFKNMMVTGPTA